MKLTSDIFNREYGPAMASVHNQEPKQFDYWPYRKPITDQVFPPIDDSLLSKFKSCGFQYNGIASVLDQDGKITFMKINRMTAAISFNFRGCHMAKFKFRGDWYVVHIYCSEGEANLDCKDNWNKFVYMYQKEIEHLILIQPTRAVTISGYEKLNATVCGLIMPDNQCYSFIMNRNVYKIVCYDTFFQIEPLRYGTISHLL